MIRYTVYFKGIQKRCRKEVNFSKVFKVDTLHKVALELSTYLKNNVRSYQDNFKIVSHEIEVIKSENNIIIERFSPYDFKTEFNGSFSELMDKYALFSESGV